MMLSPHIHFPATPSLVQTQGMTYSPTTYDRRPIAVSPNMLDLPERGARSYTPGISHELSCATGSESPIRDASYSRRRTQKRRNPKGSYFHPRAFEACERERDQEEEEEETDESSSLSFSPSEVFFSDSSDSEDERNDDSPPTPVLVAHDPSGSNSSSEDNDEVITPPPAVPNDGTSITTTFAEAAKNGTGVDLDVLLPTAPPPIPRTRKRSQEELQHALTFLPHPHRNHHNTAFSPVPLDSDDTGTPERGRSLARSHQTSPRCDNGGTERQSPSFRSRAQQHRSASSGSRRRRNAFCSTSIGSGGFSATTLLGAADGELEAACLGGF
jgi:hypothetical protein